MQKDESSNATEEFLVMKSNLSLDSRKRNVKIFRHFVNKLEGMFCDSIGARIRMSELYLEPDAYFTDAKRARSVCNIEVEEDMTDSNGDLSHGCAFYLVDCCSSIPLVTQALAQGGFIGGVSRAMDVTFHSPAKLGAKLHIISQTLSMNESTVTSRCDIWDLDHQRLVVSASHIKMESKARL